MRHFWWKSQLCRTVKVNKLLILTHCNHMKLHSGMEPDADATQGSFNNHFLLLKCFFFYIVNEYSGFFLFFFLKGTLYALKMHNNIWLIYIFLSEVSCQRHLRIQWIVTLNDSYRFIEQTESNGSKSSFDSFDSPTERRANTTQITSVNVNNVISPCNCFSVISILSTVMAYQKLVSLPWSELA